MSKKVKVIGVNMVKFTKPGQHEPYEVMGEKAIRGALQDAGIELSEIQQAYASYIYGDSTCGQVALYRVGHTGIPVINVHNNCSSGSTALYMARQAVESGAVDCALAFGFEEMQKGALRNVWSDRTPPVEKFLARLKEMDPEYHDVPMAIRFFGAAGKAYVEKYGAGADIFARVAVKTRSHAVHNPYAIFNTALTLDDVLNSPSIYPYLTRLCACPPSCGAAAVILCNEDYAQKHGFMDAVEIAAQSMTTDLACTFDDPIKIAGADLTARAARQVYEKAGIGPEDVDVVELHDCFTPNEVITYEALGLCGEGEAEKLIHDQDNTYGGKYVVNPSGGLMSKGHPIGATGLAQCTELVWHLRGQADNRQVEGAKVALQQNLGLGGAAVVTMYQV